MRATSAFINSKKDKLKEELKQENLSPEQRAQYEKELAKWNTGGLILNAIGAGLAAPTNSMGGILAATASPAISYQIGQYFKVLAHKNQITGGKDELTAGQETAHILAHAILGAAVAAAGGNDALAGGLAAAGAEATAPIVSKWLYGKDAKDLTADEKATVSAIAGLAGAATGVAVGGSMADVAQGNQAGHTAVDNNELQQRSGFDRNHNYIEEDIKRIDRIKSRVCNGGMSSEACTQAVLTDIKKSNDQALKHLIDVLTFIPAVGYVDSGSILINGQSLSGDEVNRLWGALGFVSFGYGQKLNTAGKTLGKIWRAIKPGEDLVTSTGHVIKNAEANAIKSESRGVGKDAGKEAAKAGKGANGTNTEKLTGGAARAEKFSNNWPTGNLDEVIEKFAGVNPIITITEKGKRIYTNPTTGIQVVEDMTGNYFRIYNPNISGKRAYMDLNGNIPNNKLLENGKQAGRSQGEYNEVTHFNIKRK
ncbi:hypothetical protein BGI40_11295 [Snodgrassella communis]|nr:VENN motif pre-toxin domain-containing protein [Snodgrassella communis]PIT09517.1 hypothetical protein BGI29_04135 [Snodgrassella communis]PIT25053.1 hypothetical protein BGI38_11255 [Snodgrassella communis]PIT30624.1 hypothetical protein BGI39_00025 [Snodgrassella communis]PIT30718.1 hypothetical protein BGI40_11295 [Snodgrassella communis]